MAAVTPARNTGASPSSSPRLPSPPPMPELQFGPKSPLVGSSANDLQAETANKSDDSARRRVRPGTRAADMARGPPLVPLNQLDSPFQLQEHLKALYANLTQGQSEDHVVPITRETALSIATPPQINDGEYVDKNLWLYELCRFLTMKANYVSCALMADSDPCTAQSCPEMRASEWQYLCAVHEPPKSCCAIDYVNHTLDWAANVLTSPKHFPSRLQLGGDPGTAFQSMRQLTNVFRRVYRIFAHAWFQHREVFWQIEATFGIYVLFKTICEEYSLIPKDNYTIPAEAEGPRDEAESIQISRNEDVSIPHQNGHDDEESTVIPAVATTRRHKHTPSTGSHVGTIAEGAEEEEERSSSPSKQSGISLERSPARNQLGKLNLGSNDPPYLSTQIEDPTPTIAQSATEDPLDAAGKLTASDSSLESEVRTPDGHAEDGAQSDKATDKLVHSTPGSATEKPTSAAPDTSPSASTTTTHTTTTLPTAVGNDNDDEEAVEDSESMERIELPHKLTNESVAVKDAEAVAEEKTEDVASTTAGTESNAESSAETNSEHAEENDEGEVVEVQLQQEEHKQSSTVEEGVGTSAGAVTVTGGDGVTDKTKEDKSLHVTLSKSSSASASASLSEEVEEVEEEQQQQQKHTSSETDAGAGAGAATTSVEVAAV